MANKKIELLHPITHDHVEYSRGVHTLESELADYFLSLTVPNRTLGPQPVARKPQRASEPEEGTAKPAGDEAKREPEGGKDKK